MSKCKQCGKPCKRTYCNYRCYWAWMKGKPKKNSGQFKKNQSPSNKGVFLLKARYHTIHRWLIRNFIKLGICERCGGKKKTEWSNKDGKYTRNRKDYEELCPSCHRFEDRRNPKNADFIGGTLYG